MAGGDPVVERVREANDIVEVIGEVVALKKAGSRFVGLCPFHREKTPSFSVNPAMQAYHCFGCGVGGDIFSFVMEHDKMSFPEALRHLAARAGIELPTQRGPGGDRLEKIREALRVARSFFRGQLEGPEGDGARAYLDRRGIRPETREAYGLGLALDRWDGLLRHAKDLIPERTLIEAGLAAESEGGRVYDRFRNRLMIPIETAGGAPAGFGGRLLGEGEPKYVNSPETPVYRKGALLFGTGPARDGVRAEGRVVLVEGYFDVIALVQGGIPGVVGTCGTALTPDQANLLKRLSDRVVLLFDGDNAGVKAALRALPVVAGVIPEIRVAQPPEGLDPDDWIRAEGRDVVAAAVAQAHSALAFLEELARRGVLTRRDGARRAAELAAAIVDPLDRDLWSQEGASRFGITPEAFAEAVRRLAARRDTAPGGDSGAPAGSGRRRVIAPEGAAIGSLERECLRCALADPASASRLADAVDAARVFDPPAPELLRWIAMTAVETADPAGLLSRAVHEHPEGVRLAGIAARDDTPVESPEMLVIGIQLRGVRRRMEELNRRIRGAEDAGNQELLVQYLAERQMLAAERARLEAAGRSTSATGTAMPGTPESTGLSGPAAHADPPAPEPEDEF